MIISSGIEQFLNPTNTVSKEVAKNNHDNDGFTYANTVSLYLSFRLMHGDSLGWLYYGVRSPVEDDST